MHKLAAIVILGLILLWAWHDWSNRPIKHPPGMLAPADPVQTKIAEPKPFRRGKYSVTPLAEFEIKARVLSSKRYHFDSGAKVSPVDLALGWGRMSDSAVLDKISIRQSSRFYHWRTRQYPIPRQEIVTHSANMHMVPADDRIAASLKGVRAGHVIELRGYLIRLDRDDGWHWKSSLARGDAGKGACELIWVTALDY
jgi:hypothetical protein